MNGNLESMLIAHAMLRLAKRKFGIGYEPLKALMESVNIVSHDKSEELRTVGLVKAFSELDEFIDRMVDSASHRGVNQVDLVDFEAAKERCGLIFWCERYEVLA